MGIQSVLKELEEKLDKANKLRESGEGRKTAVLADLKLINLGLDNANIDIISLQQAIDKLKLIYGEQK